MLQFGWKRKANQQKSSVFDTNSSSSDEEVEVPAKHLRFSAVALEDSLARAERLKSEGVVLAQEGRFWEAIKRFEEALDSKPHDETIWEMKAQALMQVCLLLDITVSNDQCFQFSLFINSSNVPQVHEWFPAIETVKRAIVCRPTWSVAYQTLGRAQSGLGEVELAQKSFSRAVHLDPSTPEVTDDLDWSRKLLAQLREEKLRKGNNIRMKFSDTKGKLLQYSFALKFKQ